MTTGFVPRVVLSALFGLLTLLCLESGCVYVSGMGFLAGRTQPLEEVVLEGKGKHKILVVEMSGVITEEERREIFGLRPEPSLVASVREQLDKASRDRKIAGVIFKVNSPGGTVTASDILYQEIRRFRKERNVPTVSLLMDTATSGGYYVALASDRIVAHPTSVTGSIGVVLLNLNLNGLMGKIGVSDQTVKSGRYKDLGSPFREPQPGEREILQAAIDDLHGRFCRLVEENRKGLKIADRPEITDGRIFTASQALEAGLVDEIGYFPDALRRVEKEANLTEARVVVYRRKGEYRPNIYAGWQGSGSPRTEINLFKLDLEGWFGRGGPVFLYLWQPDL